MSEKPIVLVVDPWVTQQYIEQLEKMGAEVRLGEVEPEDDGPPSIDTVKAQVLGEDPEADWASDPGTQLRIARKTSVLTMSRRIASMQAGSRNMTTRSLVRMTGRRGR